MIYNLQICSYIAGAPNVKMQIQRGSCRVCKPYILSQLWTNSCTAKMSGISYTSTDARSTKRALLKLASLWACKNGRNAGHKLYPLLESSVSRQTYLIIPNANTQILPCTLNQNRFWYIAIIDINPDTVEHTGFQAVERSSCHWRMSTLELSPKEWGYTGIITERTRALVLRLFNAAQHILNGHPFMYISHSCTSAGTH